MKTHTCAHICKHICLYMLHQKSPDTDIRLLVEYLEAHLINSSQTPGEKKKVLLPIFEQSFCH